MEDGWRRELADVDRLVTTAAEAALAGAAFPPDTSPLKGGAYDVTVLLTDDATIQDLNVRFRGKDGPTNVLSFPAPETAHPHLGDIALAHGVCAAEAAAQGKTLADHLSHLVVHGVLHLLGHEHEDDAPAEAMETMERNILARLGVDDPYRQDRVHAGS